MCRATEQEQGNWKSIEGRRGRPDAIEDTEGRIALRWAQTAHPIVIARLGIDASQLAISQADTGTSDGHSWPADSRVTPGAACHAPTWPAFAGARGSSSRLQHRK